MSGIGINVLFVDVHEDYEIVSPSVDCPLARLVRAIAQVMGQHPSFSDVQFMASRELLGDIELPERTLEIDVVLCAHNEDICKLLELDEREDIVGVFATSSGLFNPESWKADRFRVIVPCDLAALRQFVLDEREKEWDPENDRHDMAALKAYLVTVTHELAHAREFILHGHGLTPAEVDDYYDAGLIDFDCRDACTGRMVREEMAELSLEDCDLVMEDRVEAQGRQWLEWAIKRIPESLLGEVFDIVKPGVKENPRPWIHRRSG